jgi:hypothetical protein
VTRGWRFGFLLLLLLLACPALAQDDEPEEPDFFFLTGGPYTQKKYSPQIIWANQWFRDSSGEFAPATTSAPGAPKWVSPTAGSLIRVRRPGAEGAHGRRHHLRRARRG